MGKDLNNAMDSTEGDNQYDEAAKRILGNKEVLSHILTNTVDEYKEMKPEDVIPLIEGDPYISVIPVEPGLTNAEKIVNGERIVGFNTENSERYEGLIRFDVIFYILTKDGKNKIIINVEAQRNENTSYPLLNRAIFYDCRVIASQKEREFSKSNYQDIKRTYSIWICMNTGENCMNHIHLVNDNIIGDHHWKGDIDIFNLIMIGVNDNCIPEADGSKFYRFLCALFADPEKVPFQEKKDILNQEYDVWTPEIRKEVETMCNLSQSIAERAEIKGYDKGFNKGEISGIMKTLVTLVKKNRLSIAEAAEEANMTEEEFKKYLS